MLLAINSFEGGHTHTNTNTDVCDKATLRNQAHTGLWPARAWFKKLSLMFHGLYTSA